MVIRYARQPKLCNLLLITLIAESYIKNADGQIVEQHPLVQNYRSVTEKHIVTRRL